MFILFTSRKKDKNISLSLNRNLIESVSEIHFLGLILDDKLGTWKSGVANIH